MEISNINALIYQVFGNADTTTNSLKSALESATSANKTEDEKNSTELAKLKDACEGFEAIFIRQLLKIMRESGPESDLLDSGLAMDIYEDVFDEQLASEMSKSGRFGIADILYEEWKDIVLESANTENTTSKVK